MDIWDWIYPTDPRRRRVTNVVGWLLVGAMFGGLVLMPFVEERLYPPFGRLPPYVDPPDTGEKLLAGVYFVVLFLVVMLIVRYRRDSD